MMGRASEPTASYMVWFSAPDIGSLIRFKGRAEEGRIGTPLLRTHHHERVAFAQSASRCMRRKESPRLSIQATLKMEDQCYEQWQISLYLSIPTRFSQVWHSNRNYLNIWSLERYILLYLARQQNLVYCLPMTPWPCLKDLRGFFHQIKATMFRQEL